MYNGRKVPKAASFLLPSYKVLESRDIRASQLSYGVIAQPNRMFSSADFAVQLAEVTWSQGRLIYTDLRGTAVQVAVARGREVSIGLLTDGLAEVTQNFTHRTLMSGEALLYLPADDGVNVLQDAKVFSIRIPIGRNRLIQMRGRPFKVVETIDRRLDRDTAEDLLAICMFFAQEAERCFGRVHARVHLGALGQALNERVLHFLERLTPLREESDPSLIEICHRCDQAIEESNLHYSARELAELACCSERQLYRAFSKITDTTPMDYQRRSHLIRVRSHALVGSEEAPQVSAIARQFGFGSAAALQRAYRQEFGQSLLEFVEHRRRVIADTLRRTGITQGPPARQTV